MREAGDDTTIRLHRNLFLFIDSLPLDVTDVPVRLTMYRSLGKTLCLILL